MAWQAVVGFLQPVANTKVGVGGWVVYLLASAGGLSGMFAGFKWWTDRRHADRRAHVDDRRVGVEEFKAAMAGMNQVLDQLRLEIAECENDKRELRVEVDSLRREVAGLKVRPR